MDDFGYWNQKISKIQFSYYRHNMPDNGRKESRIKCGGMDIRKQRKKQESKAREKQNKREGRRPIAHAWSIQGRATGQRKITNGHKNPCRGKAARIDDRGKRNQNAGVLRLGA